ncbi:MAG: putative molybdenum carrier protein [Acidobacteriota bacterium]|nr:MAG: putative molybdenum carrier protein [Acidobacteriota bacterium]
MPIKVEKVVSGGQTGADRAGLDAAVELGLETGGWIPKGRLAEDGLVPRSYSTLKETDSANYPERTELNVRDSDCTVIVSRGKLTGGSLLTFEIAKQYGKPAIHIDLRSESPEKAALRLRDWLERNGCRVLNVAGPRASSDREIYSLARLLIVDSLAPSE